MDLEDDTHMENDTVKAQEIVNVPVMFTDEMVDAIVNRVLQRLDFNERVDDQIEYYFSTTFDINDYTNNIDFYDLRRGLVEDVIDSIKDRLS
jgi:hypothetical protein